ncbi:cadherin domain protein [Trichuris suis]|nr:cadherin domain protein [Trichuris suis]
MVDSPVKPTCTCDCWTKTIMRRNLSTHLIWSAFEKMHQLVDWSFGSGCVTRTPETTSSSMWWSLNHRPFFLRCPPHFPLSSRSLLHYVIVMLAMMMMITTVAASSIDDDHIRILPKLSRRLFQNRPSVIPLKNISEDVAVGTTVASFETYIKDPGDLEGTNYTFRIQHESDQKRQFTIGNKDGNLKVARPLDREDIPQYRLRIEVVDSGKLRLFSFFLLFIHRFASTKIRNFMARNWAELRRCLRRLPISICIS